MSDGANREGADDGEQGRGGGEKGQEGNDKTQASLFPGAEALENKFGNIIP